MKYESFDKDKFHVVTMISNPARFSRRYHLYHKFAEYIHKFTPNLWTVELQLGDRPFVTDSSDPKNIQLRFWTELWHKENALNIGISRLPDDWETCAILDADIQFIGEHEHDWITEILHELQVYQVIQPWQTAIDMGPHGHAINIHKSFMSCYLKNHAIHPETNYSEFHPGFAWAFRREAIDGMGGLFDVGIVGSGDRTMALSFVGKGELTPHPKCSAGYKRSIKLFQDKCEVTIHRDVGCMNGSLIHFWHGPKAKRFYYDRWQILVKSQFDPYTDLRKNSYGIWDLHMDGSRRMQRLRDELREYARMREEDSTSFD